MESWTKHAIWWHVYPLGFLSADPRGEDRHRGRTLADLVPWLDYARELGASGLALGPVFASATHGYDTLDYFAIDDRLGDRSAFDALVAGCRERGLRLLLDGVFNHVAAAYPDRAVLLPEDHPKRTFEGHEGLLTLDHADPAVADLVVDVMNHWLDAGADGWRLDAAYTVPRDFWGRVLPRVRERHPDAYVVGEVIHGDYAGIVAETGMDAVTQYELWKAIWSSVLDRNFFELAWALKRHNEVVAGSVPLTFVGNHDVTRIASRVGDEFLPHVLALLFTLPGTPSVYYGDEQAFRGVKEDRAGGDDAVRPEFPSSPEGLAPYGWPVYRLHQRLIGFRRRHPWFQHARVDTVRLTNTFLAYEVRDEGEGRVLVALNIGDREERVDVPAGLGEVLTESGGAVLEPGGRLRVPARRWAVVS